MCGEIVDEYHTPAPWGDRERPRLRVMVKRAVSACNLDCTCCFCPSKGKLAGGLRPGHVSDKTLEAFVRDCMSSDTKPEMRLYWPKTEAPSILPPGEGSWQPPALVVAD